MEAIGTLVGGLAHDFNNILGGIIGSVEILDILLKEQDLKGVDEVWTYINIIRNSSDRAVEMIKQLLSLSRRQKMEKKHFDVNESLQHVLTICKNSFPKSVLLDFNFSEEPCFIYADQTRIEQVILNLCVNASQAMTIMREEGEGGTLSVSLRVANRKAAEDDKLPFACITVTDDGIGMNDDVKAHMFEPFFTTKEKEMGTGLGLSMVYNIVKQHQGIIDVESTPGRGTSIELLLPLAGNTDNQKNAEKTPMAIHSGSGVVLVVDDEKPIRKIACGILENAGYRVLTAENGDEAIQVYSIHQDTIDIVLLDMSMPVMSGLDVYTALQKINPSIKVLVTSGFGLDIKVQKVLDLGANGFISKPFSTDKLTAKILQVIES
ncbi:MAG: hybrid sensor histidine kinase/response regulator, partial [Spirochaetota bacterium]